MPDNSLKNFDMMFATTILMLAAGSVGLQGATILSITGPSSCPVCPAFSNSQSVALSFTTSQSYTGVSFSPDLASPFSGTAYLMTNIGAGTTVADQIASHSFTSTDSGAGSFQSVLQGVTISPGTYYLVLSSSSSGGIWVAANPGTAIITTDLGVSTPAFYYFDSGGGGYAPAGGFSTNGQTLQVNISAVPEPAICLLLGTGVGLFWFRRNQRSARVETGRFTTSPL